MHTNHLANEKSPYLLQHAHNPVDWYAWGADAFDKAHRENKPIFLSIGYSTCHWCHVMERESFENEQIAAVLNQNFVPVKVDREERPDVDRIYMTFVQATTGSGGWPMSVWLTPELKPFFGGTYFPPDDRYGRAGFLRILTQVAEAWQQQRAQIVESSVDIVEQLRKHTEVAPGRGFAGLDEETLEGGFLVFRRTFDTRHAGFGNAPKFPRPAALHFLLRYYERSKNREALDMVLATLREMAKGGMHDQLGGGFHRYSVDARWFVPHFEKMLYDQAQLAISYLEAFQITREQIYADVARDIFDYVLRDMVDREGGFHSAEDADSVMDPAEPKVKGEGAFYIWRKAEIEALAGAPAAEWFCYRYGVEDDGNVAEDPHQEFTGKNILYQAHTVEETALRFGKSAAEMSEALARVEQTLLAERGKRIRPHLDDKVLTAWNGLMISAFAKGGAILGEARYLAAAQRAAQFLTDRMYDAKTGLLLRRYREGEAVIPGFLDDYAFLAQALVDLYEADFEMAHLTLAIELTEKMRELFEDTEGGGFFSSGAEDRNLVLRIKEDYDGAEPSGNSIAALNLLRLGEITDRKEFRESAEKMLGAFAAHLRNAPAGVPQMLAALLFRLSTVKQIMLVGTKDAPETRELLEVLRLRFLPNRIVLLVDSEEARRTISGYLPVVESMQAIDGRTTAYVCENYTCQLPTNYSEKFSELIQ